MKYEGAGGGRGGGGSKLGKTTFKKPSLIRINLMNHENQILIKLIYVLKCLIDSKAFIEYSNDMNDIYKSIKECNTNKKNINRI